MIAKSNRRRSAVLSPRTPPPAETAEAARLALERFFATVGDGLGPYADLPEGVAITFDLQGEGGGIWTLRREECGMTVARTEAAHSDCRLGCSVDDFRALLDGRLDSRRGFLEGRLDVEGDVGLVLRLERALTRTVR